MWCKLYVLKEERIKCVHVRYYNAWITGYRWNAFRMLLMNSLCGYFDWIYSLLNAWWELTDGKGDTFHIILFVTDWISSLLKYNRLPLWTTDAATCLFPFLLFYINFPPVDFSFHNRFLHYYFSIKMYSNYTELLSNRSYVSKVTTINA